MNQGERGLWWLVLALLFFGCMNHARARSEAAWLVQWENPANDNQKIEAKLALQQRYAFLTDEELVAAILDPQVSASLRVFQYEALSNRLPALSKGSLEQLLGHVSAPMQGKLDRELQSREPKEDPKEALLSKISALTQAEDS